MKEFKVKNSGITILEVLITVLVMAIGMLGFATLQLQTLNITQESYSRSQATALLESVTDMVRSNSEFLVTDPIDSLVTYAEDTDNQNWCLAPPAQCDGSGPCTGDELVKSYMSMACDNLVATNLPEAKLGARCVDRDPVDVSDSCNPGSKWQFYVSWKPTSRQDTEGTATYDQNNNCQSLFGLNRDETCIIMELVL